MGSRSYSRLSCRPLIIRTLALLPVALYQMDADTAGNSVESGGQQALGRQCKAVEESPIETLKTMLTNWDGVTGLCSYVGPEARAQNLSEFTETFYQFARAKASLAKQPWFMNRSGDDLDFLVPVDCGVSEQDRAALPFSVTKGGTEHVELVCDSEEVREKTSRMQVAFTPSDYSEITVRATVGVADALAIPAFQSSVFGQPGDVGLPRASVEALSEFASNLKFVWTAGDASWKQFPLSQAHTFVVSFQAGAVPSLQAEYRHTISEKNEKELRALIMGGELTEGEIAKMAELMGLGSPLPFSLESYGPETEALMKTFDTVSRHGGPAFFEEEHSK